MKKVFLGLVVSSLLTVPVLAQAATWEIDGAHTTVTFKVRHLLTKVTGTFQQVSGEIEFDPSNPTAGSASVTIPVSSIDTRNEKRDGHLKSGDFFDAENYPDLTFKSTKFVKSDSGLKIEGVLNMRGVDKPVTLDVEFLGSQAAMGGEIAGFSASTKINRNDWGISWNKTLDTGTLLGDDVEIQIDVEARKKG
ncbi:MAG: YceI family protein [Candidatus Eisenbacteria bacterium]|uniref:YceI family protein n=1 Tax=Eiseniibacteriota bacterium TaxID=2212470 RepID=A0A956LZ75_UNCEI|nr:YceI family protein [Candidatus Eisenbacteria bacterium]